MQMSQLFFLKDESSTVHLSGKFKSFSDFSGLKPNTERDPSGSLWFDLISIDLINEAVKILGVYFSYN